MLLTDSVKKFFIKKTGESKSESIDNSGSQSSIKAGPFATFPPAETHNILHFDSITGLPNQRQLEEQLYKEIEYAKKNDGTLLIIMIGIDDFKYVTSSLGHSKGNQLLMDFSGRIKNAINFDATIHKMNGEVYSMIVNGQLDYDAIHKLLDMLLETINKEPFIIENTDIHITSSIGASVFPNLGETVEDLVKNAEIAMYQAASKGKNKYEIFSPTMSLHSYKQFMLRNDSKKALLRNEYDIYFQPRINPITYEVVCTEALIRWIHPKFGLVLPDEFISMAEDSGLIIPIGEWMIRQVCCKIKNWIEEGLTVKKVSINLSIKQLLQENFVDRIAFILDELKINPNCIEFEISVTMLLQNEEQIHKTLTSLMKMGISIALDHFGKGFSPLSFLKEFPCDTVKIDKCLINNIHRDKDSFEIASSTISLCQRLQKSVVAEGVECKEQISLLEKLHCNEIQGFIFCPPVEEHKYKQLLKGNFRSLEKINLNTPTVNNRQFFRIPLNHPLLADMTIDQVENKKIKMGSTLISINDIGPGGLRFTSPLKLFICNGVVFRFQTEILTTKWKLKGQIVWQKETEDRRYQYGVKFILDREEQAELIRALNHLQIMLWRKGLLSR